MLNKLTTEELIDACLEYPLAFNYIAYDDQIEGVESVIKGFNGFGELLKREDAPAGLLNAYKSMDYSQRYLLEDKINKSIGLSIGYMELVISDPLFLELFSGDQLKDLKEIAEDKYEMKLRNFDYFGLFCTEQTLKVCSEIKLLTDETLSKEDKDLLKVFTHYYPIFKAKDVERVSQLVFE